eukprot:GGOE01041004.1.p1 GENE.GGOE01041004.1~~GGOE01041004.1.p1  ORF type:complete len:438 (+),score=140.13 GGOE01041004.1:132-1316(+)
MSSMVDATKRTASSLARKARPGTVKQVTGEKVQFSGSGTLVATEQIAPSTLTKFDQLLSSDSVDLDQLRSLAWQGVPSAHRPFVWKLLMGYLPSNAERRERDAARKQREYTEYVAQYFNTDSRITDDGTLDNASSSAITEEEVAMRRQIHIDVPRTNPDIPLYQNKTIQQSLERILYIWSVRHPASGYVQGLNDLATPFLTVFLAPLIEDICTVDLATASQRLATIPADTLREVEASTFWCFSRLLDSIQDHYTFAQPGIQKMIHKLKDLIRRVDGKLFDHLHALGVDFLQFAFRWVNCLFLRELPMPMAIRLWDTYLAEGDVFPTLHLYFCAVYLTHWSDRLMACGFAEAMLLLQALPASELSLQDLQMLISKAYLWRELYDASPNHLHSNSS